MNVKVNPYIVAEKEKEDGHVEGHDKVIKGGDTSGGYLVFSMRRGEISLRTSEGLGLIIMAAICLLVFVGIYFGESQHAIIKRKLKLEPEFDVSAYIYHVNMTIDGLVKELKKVQISLDVMQAKYGKM